MSVDITYKGITFSLSDFGFFNVKNIALQHDFERGFPSPGHARFQTLLFDAFIDSQ